MKSIVSPVSANERADVLDILRGFALLGILLANSAVFSQYIMQDPKVTATWPTAAADKILGWFHFAMVDGKFYSLFSLLFGIGFSIIFLKNKNRGTNGLRLFYRRLLILALFGLIHTFLIWDGDILFFYAVFGLLLPLFRNVADKTLLIIAGSLLLSPLLIDFLKVITHGRWDVSKPFLNAALARDQFVGITEENARQWLLVHKSYSKVLDWNSSGIWWGWFFRMESNRPVKVLAMFLIGLYVGRNHIYNQLEQYKPLIKKMRNWGLGIGLPAGLLHAWFQFDDQRLPAWGGLLDTTFYALNVTPLAIGYAATLALWYVNAKFLPLLKPLRYVGRMALTNYIMQSVISMIIYYGIGFGLGKNAGPTFYIPVALMIFLFQVLYSKLWFRFFNYGPLEWIWRMLTYGKFLSLKKNSREIHRRKISAEIVQ